MAERRQRYEALRMRISSFVVPEIRHNLCDRLARVAGNDSDTCRSERGTLSKSFQRSEHTSRSAIKSAGQFTTCDTCHVIHAVISRFISTRGQSKILFFKLKDFKYRTCRSDKTQCVAASGNSGTSRLQIKGRAAQRAKSLNNEPSTPHLVECDDKHHTAGHHDDICSNSRRT